MPNSYYIKTYGCQMNENDSEVIAGLLEDSGCVGAKSPDTADIILVNTCCIRQKAEDKAFGYALGLSSLKRDDPRRILGFIGCIAEKDKREIFKKLPFFDIVVGPGQEGRIVQLIDEIRGGKGGVVSTGDFCGGNPFPHAKRSKSVRAYITIMIGCNNFCSYCIVPYVRGREISRPADDILDEIRRLKKDVYKEVILLGQNVNSYEDRAAGSGGRGLAGLLEKVHDIDGIERIRFLTSHPRDMSNDIINAVKELPKVCEYFHLPLQSGDDRILKAMNRGYTSDDYRKLVGRIRERIPGAAITSDAIAGFPGETDEQFQNTLRLISELELDLVNTLAFSVRPGTAAEKMGGHLPEKVKKQRLLELMAVVEAAAEKKNRKLVGSRQEILAENSRGGMMTGRTRGNKVVKFISKNDLSGRIVEVKIKSAGAFVLEGEAVN